MVVQGTELNSVFEGTYKSKDKIELFSMVTALPFIGHFGNMSKIVFLIL